MHRQGIKERDKDILEEGKDDKEKSVGEGGGRVCADQGRVPGRQVSSEEETNRRDRLLCCLSTGLPRLFMPSSSSPVQNCRWPQISKALKPGRTDNSSPLWLLSLGPGVS